MHQDILQVCAASQSRWEWVTARAVYPKARLPDRSGSNARETFAFTSGAFYVSQTTPYSVNACFTTLLAWSSWPAQTHYI